MASALSGALAPCTSRVLASLLPRNRAAVLLAPATPQRRAVVVPVGGFPAGGRSRARRASSKVTAAASTDASTVRIIVQGRNVSVTPAIKEYVEQKVSNAVSFAEPVVKEVDVRLKVHGGDATKGPRQQMAEITVYTHRNGIVRVADTEENMYASIDKATDKLTRKLRKMKEKALPKGKWPGHKANVKGGTVITEVLEKEEVADSLPVDREPQLPSEVMRTKYFYLEAMDTSEAVDALEALDHDFFLYLDKDNGGVQVVYRRNTGGYGVIVPKTKSS